VPLLAAGLEEALPARLRQRADVQVAGVTAGGRPSS
jgi:hypothetical protein